MTTASPGIAPIHGHSNRAQCEAHCLLAGLTARCDDRQDPLTPFPLWRSVAGVGRLSRRQVY